LGRGQRFQTLLFVLTLVFFILGLQLVRIQIWLGSDLRMRAVRQQGQELVLGISRGGIYDRNYASLIDSGWEPALGVYPTLVEDKVSTARELAALLNLERANLQSRLLREQPFLLPLEPDRDVPALALFDAGAFPGVFMLQRESRYGEKALAQHLIGYIQEEGKQGVVGLEAYYDQYLRQGEKTSLVAWTDAYGQLINGLGYQQLVQGEMGTNDLILTLDARMQYIVEDVLRNNGKSGAVVIVHVPTGEILALASSPNFSQDRVEDYLTNTDGCLMNRVFLGYPPGSLFKIIVAAAALEEGLTSLDEEFFCAGYIEVGNQVYRCHQYNDGGHGQQTLAAAFAHSCNPVFISLAQRLGVERLLNYAIRFGLDSKLLGLPEETAGYLPEEVPFLGDLANIALGQGPVLVTPLQMAQVIQAVANQGILVPLRLIKQGPDNDLTGERRSRAVLSPETAQKMHGILVETVSSGTGTAASLLGWDSGGKTGTAETGRNNQAGEAITHAWFAGFVPVEEPLLAAVVLVEEGGSGGSVAAPIYREIMQGILQAIPLCELR
jgi:penicillin-binding protein 2